MTINPIWGVVLIFLVQPFESFFPELGGWTVGRIIGALTTLLWLTYLASHAKSFNQLFKSDLLKRISLFLLFATVSALSWSTAENGTNAIVGAVTFILLGMLALMLENLIHERKSLVMITTAMAVASALACVPALLYILGVDLYSMVGTQAPTDLNEETMRAPTLGGGNPNSLGIIARNGIFAAVLLLLVTQSKLRQVLAWSFLFLCLSGLVLSGSRTNFYGTIIIIAVMMAFGAFRIFKNRSQILITIGGFLIIGIGAFQFAPEPVKARLLLGGEDERIAERATARIGITEEQQLHALEFVKEYPLFGVGLDRTSVEAGPQGAHDTVSAILGETGILGTIAFTWLVLWAMFRLWKLLKITRSFKFKLCASLLLGMLVAFVIMGVRGGLIIPYDRTFWLVLGLILPVKRIFTSTSVVKNASQPAIPKSA
ncbi:MAG TPA: hypothetical protein DCG19_08725 [Cryomorphaceae bacterium]|nr:hypothetical protein [Owenweeksia sp.]MBF98715.1 hypothetical protein [Owenweeksia sp.]HAD97477.1 hypothetical protein [Cryomorphaceae bacterium]HBF19618.1 hypothetical protein [Cryomorphaceae bacterium]